MSIYDPENERNQEYQQNLAEQTLHGQQRRAIGITQLTSSQHPHLLW